MRNGFIDQERATLMISLVQRISALESRLEDLEPSTLDFSLTSNDRRVQSVELTEALIERHNLDFETFARTAADVLRSAAKRIDASCPVGLVWVETPGSNHDVVCLCESLPCRARQDGQTNACERFRSQAKDFVELAPSRDTSNHCDWSLVVAPAY